MKLHHGLYIDAGYCGNSARFINHSCEPNCFVQVFLFGAHALLTSSSDVASWQGEPFGNICEEPHQCKSRDYDRLQGPINDQPILDSKLKCSFQMTSLPGDEGMKCLCGSERCRGWLAKPTASQVCCGLSARLPMCKLM